MYGIKNEFPINHQHDTPLLDFEIENYLNCETFSKKWWKDLIERCAQSARDCLNKMNETDSFCWCTKNFEKIFKKTILELLTNSRKLRDWKGEKMKESRDGISQADIDIRPHHLLCTVCTLGGVKCPLLPKNRIDYILKQVRYDATLRIKLVSNCDEIVHFREMQTEDYAQIDTQEVFNRKRDLDVLQKLGLMPGATMKARELFNLLFKRIPSTKDICGYGDGVVTSREWSICQGGDEKYKKTIKNGIFSL